MKTNKAGVEQFATVTDADHVVTDHFTAIERNTARVAGALLLLRAAEQVLNILSRARDLVAAPFPYLWPSLVGAVVELSLLGVPAMWLIRGRLIHRKVALVSPILLAVAYAVTAATTKVTPHSLLGIREGAFLSACIALLTRKPSTTRLRLGVVLGAVWLAAKVWVAVTTFAGRQAAGG